ncbi:hypothetical protein EYF80_051869 [Liparis tanakae]|uniref:Uncharacterized protein n=1 Tax=Liparis tanakae TaxID=230148 RepID=A0A4Z2FC53_9TELE|nr:hypothetical protein EYF80_051869 [Liparis tanakae]
MHSESQDEAVTRSNLRSTEEQDYKGPMCSEWVLVPAVTCPACDGEFWSAAWLPVISGSPRWNRAE